MLSASETDRTTVEARPRAEAEQLLEDNLQLKRHKLEEASTCDGVVKLIKRYDRDRHATLDELNAGLAGIISRRTKLRRERRIRDEWEAEVVALQAQVHADGPRYKRLRNIKQKIAADLERDKQQVKQRQASVDETTAARPPHSVSVTPLELEFWVNGKVDANDTSLADLKALELGDHPKEAITHLRGLKKGRRELQTKFKREANYWSRAYREIARRGHKVLFFLCERLNIHVIDPPLEDAAAEDTKVRPLDFVTTVPSHDAKHGDVVFESECKAAFRYFPRVGATWKATEPPVAKALRESKINEDVHATRPGLAKILRMCTYLSAFNLNKVKNDEKCVMRYVDEKEVSLCPRNDENVCVCDRDGNAVLRLLRWKGEAEEVNQVATQLAKFEDADDLGIDKNKPEERLEVEDGLLKLVARFYARIRPALFAWLRPLEVAKEILLGYKLFEDGPSASKNMPWLGMAWGRFVAAAQHVDQDATLGMLICVDDPNRVLRGSHFYFGGLDILIKLNHGDVLLFDPRLQHGVTEGY